MKYLLEKVLIFFKMKYKTTLLTLGLGLGNAGVWHTADTVTELYSGFSDLLRESCSF